MNRLTLGEIFNKVPKLPTNPDKTKWLREHANPGVFYILKLAFNKPQWLLPEGAPPFKQDPGSAGLTPSHLMRELRTLYLFFEGGNRNLTQLRREKLFQGILERMDPQENHLLLALKDGTFPAQFKCTKKLVEETFPGLLQTPFTTVFLRA